MPSLRHINLNKTRITDASLDLLARLRNLEYLEVSATMVSDEAIARFKAAKPGCTVETYGRRPKAAY